MNYLYKLFFHKAFLKRKNLFILSILSFFTIINPLIAKEDSKVIEILKREFKDSMEISEKGHNGPIGTFNNFLSKQEITKRIDYIFIYGMKIVSHEHVNKKLDNGNHLSDHLPVVTNMKISK